jgi:hypothetical protein
VGVLYLTKLSRGRMRPVVALYRFSCRLNRGDTGGVGDTASAGDTVGVGDTGGVGDTEGAEAVRVLETDKV